VPEPDTRARERRVRSAALDPPPGWQQAAHLGPTKAVVHQHHHAAVIGSADHAPRGLHHLLQAGKQVGVVIAAAVLKLQPRAQLFVQRVHLGQAQRGDEGPDQALARQVDAFTKCPAEHGKADALAVLGEAGHKRRSVQLGHAARLGPRGNVRVHGSKARQHLLQVVKAAEKREVVARLGLELFGHHRHHRVERFGAVLVAGGDVRCDAHLQLCRVEG